MFLGRTGGKRCPEIPGAWHSIASEVFSGVYKPGVDGRRHDFMSRQPEGLLRPFFRSGRISAIPALLVLLCGDEASVLPVEI